MRKRRALLAITAVVAVLVVVMVAASILVRTHHAPPALGLATKRPSGPGGSLAGLWTVASGSTVGYRVREQFINQPGPTEAVARTARVKGSLVVAVGSAGLSVSHMQFTVDLASLVSQDRYATYQTYQRDFFIRRIYLETDRFPTATFVADSLSLPAEATGPVPADVHGRLNVHGVTRNVVAHVDAQATGDRAELAGSISVDMRDFAIEVPDISFTRAEPQVTIEYDLRMARA